MLAWVVDMASKVVTPSATLAGTYNRKSVNQMVLLHSTVALSKCVLMRIAEYMYLQRPCL